MNDETLVTQRLPDSGTRVLAFGHKTYCCSEDMDEKPEWHECTFKMEVISYGLKPEVPADPEESILRCYEVYESWDIEEVDYGAREHLIGVTKWKKIDDSNLNVTDL